MLTDSDDEVTFSEVIARRVFIVTEGERRVVAVEEDVFILTGTSVVGHEVRTERYGHGTASRCYVEAVAIGIHQVAVDLLTHVVGHEGVTVIINAD